MPDLALPIFADPKMRMKMCISNIYISSISKGLSFHIFVESIRSKVWKIRKERKGRSDVYLPHQGMGGSHRHRRNAYTEKRPHLLIECSLTMGSSMRYVCLMIATLRLGETAAPSRRVGSAPESFPTPASAWFVVPDRAHGCMRRLLRCAVHVQAVVQCAHG